MQMEQTIALLCTENSDLQEELRLAKDTNNYVRHAYMKLQSEFNGVKSTYDVVIAMFTKFKEDHYYFARDFSGVVELVETAGAVMSAGLNNICIPFCTRGEAFDVDRLMSYSNADWIACQAKGLNSRAVQLDIKHDASLFLHFLHIMLAYLNPNSDMHSDLWNKVVVNILASLHEYKDVSFVNPLALKMAITLVAKTQSTDIVNLVGNLVPGGVSRRYVEYRIDQSVENVGELKDIYCKNNVRSVMIFDNHGSYKQVTLINACPCVLSNDYVQHRKPQRVLQSRLKVPYPYGRILLLLASMMKNVNVLCNSTHHLHPMRGTNW